MDLIKQLTTQLTQIWTRWTVVQRIGMVVVTCLCVSGVVMVGIWASTKDFVTLTNSLTPAQAHEIVSTLEAEGIEYELNFSGSAVSVPVADVSRARLAIKELGHDVAQTDDEFGSGLFTDPTQQRSRAQRALERRLALSIMQMQSVRSATVHLTMSEQSPFIREKTPTKASVVLQLAPGNMFSSTDSRAIVSLVSHAVENLNPEDTIIVDTDGHVLSESDALGGDVSGQLEFRRKLEAGLSAKAEAMLTPVLGHGRAIVRVTADIDFTEKNTARTSYDPDGKVKTRESISTETTRGPGGSSAGAGTSSNVGSLTLGSSSTSESDVETIDTEYQNTETVDTIREAPGQIRRLTIAAVVQLPDPADKEEATAATAAVPEITQAQVEKIIRQAVGFDETRSDEIEVLAAKMTGVPDLMAPAGWTETVRDLSPLVGSVSLIVASVIALFLGMKMIGRLKPVVVEVDRRQTLDPETRARLADISDEIRENPDAVSTVLAGWLAGQTKQTVGKPAARKAA
ncbi:MAG: flagellar basal-body MS-ring/collar protein FliF [Planctomycetaceae bacterium]